MDLHATAPPPLRQPAGSTGEAFVFDWISSADMTNNNKAEVHWQPIQPVIHHWGMVQIEWTLILFCVIIFESSHRPTS